VASPAIAIAQAIIPYALTEYSVGGLTVTQDDYVLAVAVASRRSPSPVVILNHLMQVRAVEEIMGCSADGNAGVRVQPEDASTSTCFTELSADQSISVGLLNTLRAGAQNAGVTDAESALTTALGQYQSLLSTLLGGAATKAPQDGMGTPKPAKPKKNATPPKQPDGTTPPDADAGAITPPAFSFAAAVREKAILDALSPDHEALYLKIESSTGGYYTRKNLWTALGLVGVPFKVAGGAVISWALTDSQGNFKGGDVCPVISDYVGLTDTPKTVKTISSETSGGPPCEAPAPESPE
jgi:hypothetical protein